MSNTPEAQRIEDKPMRIWAMWCPFRKTGSPVLGSFGATERQVIIIPVESWKKLCAENPGLQTRQFEVGTVE